MPYWPKRAILYSHGFVAKQIRHAARRQRLRAREPALVFAFGAQRADDALPGGRPQAASSPRRARSEAQ